MKKMWFAIAVLGLSLTAAAQSEKFTGAMQKNLAQFDSAKTVEDFNRVANTFERIGDAEKSQWLPYYYAGLSLSMSGWMNEVGDKDAHAARILVFCDKAEAVAASDADRAEIMVLRNMAATQQMMVDPATRWATYGQSAGQAIEKGMKLDPSNPRLYYLRGMSVFNTPVQFGGGKDKAKPVLEKAVELFKQENPRPLYPHWGKAQAEQQLAQCQ